MVTEFEQLERLGRARRISVVRRGAGFTMRHRDGAAMDADNFEEAKTFLEHCELPPIPPKDVRHRILVAAAKKRRFWFEEIDGEDDAYTLATFARHDVIFERVGFRELIEFLDSQP